MSVEAATPEERRVEGIISPLSCVSPLAWTKVQASSSLAQLEQGPVPGFPGHLTCHMKEVWSIS